MSRYDISLSVAFPPPPVPAGVTLQPVEILAEYPHDPEAVTHGLLWADGKLFESCGSDGRSEVRELKLANGATLRRAPFPHEAQGRGLADWQDEILAVTLNAGIACRFERDSLMPLASLPFPGAGWGVARLGEGLAVSDGSAVLRFVDPESMAVSRSLEVREADAPLTLLNDLTAAQGELLANVFMTATIARIDPATGEARGRLDLAEVAARSGRRDAGDGPSAIAYDEEGDRLFVTGRYWPKLFAVSLPPFP